MKPNGPLPLGIPPPEGVDASPVSVVFSTAGPRNRDGGVETLFQAVIRPSLENMEPRLCLEHAHVADDGRVVVDGSLQLRVEVLPHLAVALWQTAVALGVDPYIPEDPKPRQESPS